MNSRKTESDSRKTLKKEKVICGTNDNNGFVTGSYNPNPFLNALTYEVEFYDDEINEFSDNVS